MPDAPDTFFETLPRQTHLPRQPHSMLHTRVWDHPGAIVDLGCRDWDFCATFLGKKRVIGVDPDLRVMPIAGAELMQCLIGPYNGIVSFQGETSIDAPAAGPQASMWTWRRFAKANIDSRGIAALKINIEGGEWPLLASMSEEDFKPIDQIAVSFHDFWLPSMAKASKAIIGYLESLGYKSKPTDPSLGWVLFY